MHCGGLILPGCSKGILEGIGTKTAALIAEDDIEVAKAAVDVTGQDPRAKSYGRLGNGRVPGPAPDIDVSQYF
ncbi:hypothetical protein [Peribacillus sp. NPDC096448]|uniref:hypothetical protein n=1 Tax=Peribacillus sp. NPDC096448 TaxID=3364395 RepID=UPI0037FF64DC